MRIVPATILASAAVLALGFGLAAGRNAADSALPQAGQRAPAFSLPSEDGTKISLKSFPGKWVVLYFYPKDMSHGCTIEAHHFQADLPKYEQMDAVIVGVSVDPVSSHQEFCAKDGLHFKLLSDQDKTVVRQYGSLGDYLGIKIAKRNTFLINPQGEIVKVWTGVDPSAHSQEVLAELAQVERES
jgi:thioredoxin-dependent peroxiredoxin